MGGHRPQPDHNPASWRSGSDRELPLLIRCSGDSSEAIDHGGTENIPLRWFGEHGGAPVKARLLAPGYRSFDQADRCGDNRGDEMTRSLGLVEVPQSRFER